MDTRMGKYNEEPNSSMSRTSRNTELYKTINKGELENYDIKSNATLLGTNDKNQIDIDKIKKILDTRYNDTAKRKSIRLEKDEEVIQPEKEETTKEYDINAILQKAKNEKPISYEEDRAKKLRDTQYDILNNLNLDEKEENDNEPPQEDEARLMDLINTISLNEQKVKEKPEDDFLDDLKGNENTEVFEGMKEELEKQTTMDQNTIIEKIDKIEKDDSSKTNTISLDNTAFSKSMEFSKKDFENFDLDGEKTSPLAKIIITIIIIAFLVGIFFFVKSIFNF